jgi:hypothetical protein
MGNPKPVAFAPGVGFGQEPSYGRGGSQLWARAPHKQHFMQGAYAICAFLSSHANAYMIYAF